MTNFQRNFSTGEVEVEGSVIYHELNTANAANALCVLRREHPVDGFDTDMETFLGLYNGFVLTVSPARSRATPSLPAGSRWRRIEVKVSLPPASAANFVLGYVRVPQAEVSSPSVINKARKPAGKADDRRADCRSVRALKKHWDNLLSAYRADHARRSWAAWSISGIPISAWSRST